MRVFVTGATGWVGSAVVKELIAAGHGVLGLARSDKGAEALASAGALVHRGSLADLDSLRSGTASADAVIHTAFNHDFSKFAENCAEPANSPIPRKSEAAAEALVKRGVRAEGVPFKEIAEVIGRRLNIPVVSKSAERAAEHFGWFAMFAGIDAPASSARTRAELGWKPEQPGLIADLDHPAYFAS